MYQRDRPRGEARREAILRATLAVIGEQGPDSVTHRAVAERAGVPVSSTTYHFASKEELLEQTVILAAREEVERLERLVLELAPLELSVEEWAAAVAHTVAADVESNPGQHVAFLELVLEATRRPALAPEAARWQEAHLRLAEMGARAVGSSEPPLDAGLVVATITGLVLGQLVSPAEDFEDVVLRPALERLFSRLAEPLEAPAPV
jgi:DNA-binding transcriptional regulator YbjK